MFWIISKQLKQTELFWNKQNQTETTLNFQNNIKICSLSNFFGWSSVCFVQSKHQNSLFWYRSETTEKTVLKQTKTNRNKPKQPKFPEKIPKYALYQTVLVALLFVLVQSKHWNSLFWYRTETKNKKNILFRIVPKLVLVPVSVVSNWN